MDNAKSVIDIEVNDGEFQRFQELFTKYKEALSETPGQWEKSSDSIGSNVAAMRELIAAMQAQRKLIDENAAKRKEAAEAEKAATAAQRADEKRLDDERKAREKRIQDEIAKQNELYKRRVKFAKDLGGELKGIIGTTASIGINISKWVLGISMGVLGGGLFGLDRLAGNATQERTQSRILGVTPGQLRAWRTDFGNYGSPDSLLSAASNAPTDALTRARFMRAGVGADVIRSGNTSEIAAQALTGLSDFFKRNQGPNAQAVWRGYGYDQIMSYNDMRAFAGASPGEQREVLRNIRRDTSSMGTSDTTMKAWQDFYTQLQRAGTELKTTFLDGLVKLSGPIGDLSKNLIDLVKQFMSGQGFKEMIEVVSNGIKDLGQSMKDGSFNKAIHDLMSTLKEFVESGALSRTLGIIESGLKGLAAVLGIFAPSTTDAGKENAKSGGHWKSGAALGAGIGAAAGSIVPGIGTGIGAVLGAGMGATAGAIYDMGSLSDLLSPGKAHADSLGFVKNHGVSDKYLDAIAKTESGGNPNAVSKAGAQGLMQLMPSVQKQYGVKNPFDPAQSRAGAAALLGDLIARFKGDMVKVTAAYNAGGGRVSKAISAYGDRWLEHLPSETQQYVGKVSHNMQASGSVTINISNATGGNAVVTARQAMAS